LITTTTKTRRITTALFDNDNDKENYDNNNNNNNKFKIATSGILSYHINILNRLQAKSKENASTIYLFSMHNEINPSISYKTNQIITLSQLSESYNNNNNNNKPFYK
jgi:hypothetical protein